MRQWCLVMINTMQCSINTAIQQTSGYHLSLKINRYEQTQLNNVCHECKISGNVCTRSLLWQMTKLRKIFSNFSMQVTTVQAASVWYHKQTCKLLAKHCPQLGNFALTQKTHALKSKPTLSVIALNWKDFKCLLELPFLTEGVVVCCFDVLPSLLWHTITSHSHCTGSYRHLP